MTMDLIEVNFDGIVGPTHHFGGLGVGNLASIEHRGLVSNPKLAAQQGIAKLDLVSQIGDNRQVRAAVLPPQLRPNITWLRSLGFSGDDENILHQAGKEAPRLLYAAWSASSMWTANAATVSPSPDCADGKLHLTVANLTSNIHRSIEADETFANLKLIFDNNDRFSVHPALPGGYFMRDEGAANHMRLSSVNSQGPGIEVFVHGQDAGEAVQRFLPRQSDLASRSVARRHRLRDENTFFVAQHPAAIDAGAFHNDVVATSCENVLLYHEHAFADAAAALGSIRQRYLELFDSPLFLIQVDAGRVSLQDAISSYLFNSQLIRNNQGKLTLVSPAQCSEIDSVREEIDSILVADNPISEVRYVDLRESMWNGGGPACLRLRVSVTAEEFAAMHPGVLWNTSLGQKLSQCVDKYYRDQVCDSDLTDINFARQAWDATRAIQEILGFDRE